MAGVLAVEDADEDHEQVRKRTRYKQHNRPLLEEMVDETGSDG